MQRFTIFTKSDKFHWTNNKIIYSILFFCLALLFLINGPGNVKSNFVNNAIITIFISTFFYGIILSIFSFSKSEPLMGKLEGYLIFEMNSIQIHDEIFYLEKIKKIKITNDDYCDKHIYSRMNFNGSLSNGVNNLVKIELFTGEFKTCNYELREADDFQKLRWELINYYINGKLEFDNLADVLGEEKKDEIKELKEQIEKAKANVVS